MKDYLKKAYCYNQGMRIFVADTTNINKHAQEIFNMWPTSAAALGRVLTISAIMSCTYKANEYLNIKVMGDGDIGQITVEASDGVVRGFAQNPGVYLAYNDGRLDLKDAVGSGSIEVIKDLHMRQPFSSSCELVSGEIAEDFTYYFAKSEQIPSAVGLGEIFDNETNKIKVAGGFLIQVMPGCKKEDIGRLEEKLNNLKPIAKMLDSGMSLEDIINEITDGDYQILEDRELEYKCKCSKERFARGLKTLGKEQLLDILNTDKKAEITCNFCNTKYQFSEDDLKEIIMDIK